MSDLTALLLASETFEEAINTSSHYELREAIRELHRLLATAKAEGAAEALRSLASGWHHHSGHETLPEAYPRPCKIGCTKCFILSEAKLYDDRAAAIRKAAARGVDR